MVLKSNGRIHPFFDGLESLDGAEGSSTSPVLEKEMVKTKAGDSKNTAAKDQAIEKVPHRFPMPLPVTVSNEEALREFDEGARRDLALEHPLEYAVEPFIEGIFVEMVYENGSLALASTRGDGVVGDDITRNAKTILTVPLRLEKLRDAPPFPELLVVWGRVYMETEPFQLLNRRRKSNGQPAYRTAADAAADSLLQLDPKVTATRPLNMFCTGVGGMVPHGPSETRLDLMLMIQQWGLRVNRAHLLLLVGIEAVVEHCRHVKESTAEPTYPVAGAMIHLNRLSCYQPLGDASGIARWAAVFPFQ